MSNIEVTVWCLAYNHEKYIRSALEGFVKQKTNFRYEVIVHDDASTDNTAKIIREYEEKYPDIIKPIYQEMNQFQLGVNKMRNFLLPNAKGKFIAYCEGDDFWTDEYKLQKQYDVMNKCEEIALCVHKVEYLNEDNSYTGRYAPSDACDIHRDILFTPEEMVCLMYRKDTYPFHTSSYMVRKDVLCEECYQQLKKYFNGDACILHSAILCGQIYYIDEIMSCRRLLTIGNYNNRLKKMSNEERNLIRIKSINGRILFDVLSKHRFHDVMVPFIYKAIMQSSFLHGEKIFREKFFEYKKENKFPYIYSTKLTLEYILFFCPKFIRNMVSNWYCKTRLKSE